MTNREYDTVTGVIQYLNVQVQEHAAQALAAEVGTPEYRLAAARCDAYCDALRVLDHALDAMVKNGGE